MKRFAVRAVLIVFTTVILFFVADFFVAVPALERVIMDQKKEMIRELTNSAWNILARYQNDEGLGTLSRQEAQDQAVIQIRNLHYGIEMKDYFWINDLHPRMVIHPYRSDLNGTDLTGFKDPTGKHLFVDVVETVQKSGSGYVSYMWQWMDDPGRIVPKISYVKLFEPWGWVIGTGVYIDDIQREIRAARQHVISVTAGVLVIAASLMIFLLFDSLKVERKRQKAERALKSSEERYRMLVESAGEWIFMGIDRENLFANHGFLEFTGYSIDEFHYLTVSDFLESTDEEIRQNESYICRLLKGDSFPERYETWLKTKSGERHEITVSLSRVTLQGQPGFIALASALSPRRAQDISREKIMGELQSLVFFLERSAGQICSDRFTVVSAHDTAVAAAEKFKDKSLSVLAVQDDGGRIMGLISRERLFQWLHAGKQVEVTPVGQLLPDTFPSVFEGAPAYEAFVRMEEHEFVPLPVIDAKERLVGVLTERDLVLLQQYSPTLLLREIEAAHTAEDLTRINRTLPEMIRILFHTGLHPSYVNRIITQNTRAILHRALDLAFEKHGPAPCEFVFMVLGSEGRYEQTLRTDQDNAIIYRDPPADQARYARDYFLTLGTEVCDILNAVGYTYCDGGIMAKNPVWNQPVSQWKATFRGWLNTLEAEDLLKTRIFFDFRCGAGNSALIEDLRLFLDEEIEQHPRFFLLLTRNVLLYEPPVGLFGNFVFDPEAGNRQAIDIKSTMTLIVDFARIYALKHHVWVTNTRERLESIHHKGVLTQSGYEEILQLYDYLMRLRIDNQVRAIDEHRPPDNYIEPEKLTAVDQKLIREIFTQIKHFQSKLSYDFTGMMPHA